MQRTSAFDQSVVCSVSSSLPLLVMMNMILLMTHPSINHYRHLRRRGILLFLWRRIYWSMPELLLLTITSLVKYLCFQKLLSRLQSPSMQISSSQVWFDSRRNWVGVGRGVKEFTQNDLTHEMTEEHVFNAAIKLSTHCHQLGRGFLEEMAFQQLYKKSSKKRWGFREGLLPPASPD